MERVRTLSECTEEEIRDMCIENLWILQRLLGACIRKCANCEYPLSALVENFYSTYAKGAVCELCHAVEASCSSRKFFTLAHEEWEADQKAKKRMMDRNNYL